MTRRLLLGLLVSLCAAWDGPDPHGRAPADTIYYNGVVETLDGDLHRAEALAVKGTKIIDIGSSARILAHHRRASTRLVDLGGRALLPGFVDAHTHFFNDFESSGLSLEELQDYVLSRGVTTLGNPTVYPGVLEVLQDFVAAGKLIVRTSLYLSYNSPCGDVPPWLGEWYLGLTPSTAPDELLRLRGVKIFSDGGSCHDLATTFLIPDEDSGELGYGDLYFDQATLDTIVARADAAGWQVLIHALGDRGRDVALGAIEATLAGRPNRARHRIDHNSFVRPEQIDRYRDAGILAVVFPGVGTCAVNAGTSIASWLPPEDRGWATPNRTMLDAGATLAWHGDWCCGRPLTGYGPLRAIFNFVTRAGLDSDDNVCEPPPWVAAEAVTTEEALRLTTLSAAYALGMDRLVGSLEIGKLADLVILSDDPLLLVPDDLRYVRVLATMVGGKTRFCSAELGPLCD